MSPSRKTAARSAASGKAPRPDVVDPAVELTLISGTSLYRPTLPGKGDKLYFLRWEKASPPPALILDDTWANSGEPDEPGYLLFFSALFADTQAPAIEGNLRKLLSQPVTTAFAWVNFNSTTSEVTLSTLLKTTLKDDRPVVDGETTVTVFRGVQTVVFPDRAMLQGVYNQAGLEQVLSTYSSAVSPQQPTGTGVALPLAGGPNGKLVGCLSFLGLTNALDNQPPNRVLKSLMDVAMDPLNPLDQSRNYQTFTGTNYILVETAGGYQLLPGK